MSLTKEKLNTLRDVRNLINTGKIVRVFAEGNSHGITLWVNLDRPQFIMWQCFGQSANRNTMKDLTWIVNQLYKAKGKAITYKVVEGVYS